MRDNGFKAPDNPILAPITSIENRDAILKRADDGTPLPHPAEWPEADFIIGNPPFLGSKLFRKWGLSEEYLQALFAAYDLPKTSDLCCYWFELAHRAMKRNPSVRVGLLATQGIRGGDNRTVLERIRSTGNIFWAWSDRPWVLDGAAVRVSMVGFTGRGDSSPVELNGSRVSAISAALTSGSDTSTAVRLPENSDLAFMGDTKGGGFDLGWEEARTLLASPNPSSVSNADVVRPWVNGLDITRRSRSMWIIDFGASMSLQQAAQYERPFQVIDERVRPQRSKNRRESYAERWWLHAEPRPRMRERLSGRRFVATPNLTKFRLFTFMPSVVLPDHQLIAFVREDYYFFGVLHSSIHELWSLRMGTRLESRPRYTPTSCFETFPLPWPPGKEPADHPAYLRIAEAARELNDQRERWLNPPEWIGPIAARIDAADDFSDVPPEARPLIRHSAIMAAAAKDPRLKKRTLTNLYNARPTWLRLAHEKLDRAVLAAYAATDEGGDWHESWAEVWTETGAGQPLPESHPLHTRRTEIDEKVLAHLLRLNHARAT